LVLWHGCQIDEFEKHGKKPESWFAGVVPLLDINQRLQPQDRVNGESGQHRSFFDLPGDDALLKTSFPIVSLTSDTSGR